MKSVCWLGLMLLMSPFISSPLWAHNVIGGVYASGADIEGEIGYSNGVMAKSGSVVHVFDEAGTALGEAIIDEEGYFVFSATQRITHVFRANLGAGHSITLRLPYEELSEQLASPDVHPQAITNVNLSKDAAQPLDMLALDKAIAKQIKPLRREIQALREKSGLRDIIGGMGYIFGLLGIVALLRERRLKAQANQQQGE